MTGRARLLAGLFCALMAGGILAAAVGATVVAPQPAAAAPGTAGTPQAPKVLFTENFENAPKTGQSQSLDAYTSSSAEAPGEKYTADAAWLDRSLCNGLLVSSTNTPAAGDCSAQNQGPAVFNTLQTITSAMGTINGTGSANTAVAAYTENRSPFANNLIEFSTVDQLSLPAASGRFLTFSVNAAAANCNRGVSDPRLRFYFKSDDGTLTPVSSEPIDPCLGDPIGTDPGGRPILGGQFPANGSLLGGSTVGIVMKNENGSGAGNDGAFDDIKVLDGTPQLDKAFSPESITQGSTSTLTFTVTNTSDLAAKNGWSFADTLPANVTTTGANSSTCDGTTVTGAAGTASITSTGTLNAGQDSCTVSVEVTSNTVGTYVNTGCASADGSAVPGCTSNVTTTGLNQPGSSTLIVTPAVVTSDPVTSDPVTSDPVTSDPVTSDPVTSDPVTSDPVTSDPVTSDPVTSDPVTSDPVTSDPVTSDPVTSDPVTSDPVTSNGSDGALGANAGRAASGSQAGLATTGTDVARVSVLGIMLIGVGAGIVVAVQRRRPRHG